jgi:hypothetical protein
LAEERNTPSSSATARCSASLDQPIASGSSQSRCHSVAIPISCASGSAARNSSTVARVDASMSSCEAPLSLSEDWMITTAGCRAIAC